jgi:beta-glucanase (GH16 family)
MKKFIYISIVIVLQLGLGIQIVNAQSWPECNGYTKSLTTPEFHVCYTDPWALVFSDEFNGDTLDLSVWDPKTGSQRNGEAEYSKPENVVVNNGTLKIITKRAIPAITGLGAYPSQTYYNYDYSSGEIWSKNRFSYGKYEARIKIPGGFGLWPAFWMFGANGDGGEIDVFEFSAKDWNEPSAYTPSYVDMTTHYQGNMCQTTHSYDGNYPANGSYAVDFFIYTVIYEKYKIEWYINGYLISAQYLYTTLDGSSMGCNIDKGHPVITLKNKSFPFEPSFNIILNTAIQMGDIAPNANTPFPAQMEVDWVRFYERKPCGNTVNISDQSQIAYNVNLYGVNTYNSLFASDITISPTSTVDIASNKQYKMVAKNSIVLKPGFNVNSGADYNAKIDPLICTNSYRVASDDETTVYIPEKETQSATAINASDKILVYPNPAQNTFTLSLNFNEENNTSVKIYNSTGIQIYASSLGELKSVEQLIDLNLENGIYLIKVNHGNKEYQQKLVITK